MESVVIIKTIVVAVILKIGGIVLLDVLLRMELIKTGVLLLLVLMLVLFNFSRLKVIEIVAIRMSFRYHICIWFGVVIMLLLLLLMLLDIVIVFAVIIEVVKVHQMMRIFFRSLSNRFMMFARNCVELFIAISPISAPVTISRAFELFWHRIFTFQVFFYPG